MKGAVGVGVFLTVLVIVVMVGASWRIASQPVKSTADLSSQGQLMVATVGLAFAAVVAGTTIYYAVQNRRAVEEMRLAREEGARPHLAIHMARVTSTVVFPSVVNAGPGAAIAVDVTLAFVPVPGSDEPAHERRWRESYVGPGERHEFLPPDQAPGQLPTGAQLAQRFTAITLVGSVQDTLGRTHLVHEEVGDVAEWQRLAKAALIRYEEPWEDRLVREVERVRRAMETLARATNN